MKEIPVCDRTKQYSGEDIRRRYRLDEINNIVDEVIKEIKTREKAEGKYPIGYILITSASDDPGELYGGTWKKHNDVFLYASGEFQSGDTGGEKSVILNEEQIPAHKHNNYVPNKSSTVATDYGIARTTEKVQLGLSKAYHYETTEAGGSKAHNNMPPYLVVNIWERIR